MTAQYISHVPRATNAPPMRGSKAVGWADGVYAAEKRDVHFDQSLAVAAAKRRQQETSQYSVVDSAAPWGGQGDKQRGNHPYGPSMDSRLRQHIECFVERMGGAVEEGRHFAQLLQLEFRDVLRKSEEAEAEVVRLRDQVQHAETRRREKEAADRSSFAGMVLAHSDASAQLRSQLRAADQNLNEAELERQALADELGAKDAVIAELERKVAQLVTSAEVKREQANPVIAQLERKVAQLVTAAEVKSEKENQTRLAWEARISSKWEAYWAVRRPRVQEAPALETTGAKSLPETTKANYCPSSTVAITSAQDERVLTREKKGDNRHHHDCRGDHRYIWEEEEGQEKIPAEATTRCYTLDPPPKDGCQGSRPPKAAAPFQRMRQRQDTSLAVSSRRSRSSGSRSTCTSTSASGASPPPSSPGFATTFDSQCAERCGGSQDNNPRHHPTSRREDNSNFHDGRRSGTNQRGILNTFAGGAAIGLSPPSPSAFAANALPPAPRCRSGGEEGGDGAAVSSKAIEREGGGGVDQVQQDESSDRLKPQYGGKVGGSVDGCAASIFSSGEKMRVVVETPQRQATAEPTDRWARLPPSSLAMRTSEGLNQGLQHVEHWHQHEGQGEGEGSRRSQAEHDFGGVGLARRHVGGESYHPQRDEEADGEGERAASVTAADVAAAAEAVAISFAHGSPVSQSSLPRQNQPQQQEQQKQQQRQKQQQQHRRDSEQQQYNHVHHHVDRPNHYLQEQVPSPLSSLSWPADTRTPPKSDWCPRSEWHVDPYTAVSLAAAAVVVGPGRTSVDASGSAYDTSVSSSRSQPRSRSFTSRSTSSSGSFESRGRRRRRRRPGTVFGGTSGSDFASSPASGPAYQPPRGRLFSDGQRGLPEHFRGPGRDTAAAADTGNRSWCASRPAASNMTKGSTLSSYSGCGYGDSRSSRSPGTSSSGRPSTAVSTEASRSGASSTGGSASRLGCSRISRGGGGGAGRPQNQSERSNGARREAPVLSCSREGEGGGRQRRGHETGQEELPTSQPSRPT